MSPVLTAVESADHGEATSARVLRGHPLQAVVHDDQATTDSFPLTSEATIGFRALRVESSTKQVISAVDAVALQSVQVQGSVVKGVTPPRPAVETVKKAAIPGRFSYFPEWLWVTTATVSVGVVFFSAGFVTMLVLEKTCPHRRRRSVTHGTVAPSSTVNSTTVSRGKAAQN
ncbi:uncharacterized protein LOC129595067 [Paramacrobiotus metropolitanus]|uniref:uncharacterized protein LOC129595067 n=1 Tax=Paramacrobiotus metropolitanus TaxID=2943436 RepID=UPI00244647AE|nr:uncharacterized protein LOC129595067 [Paramacrobiotus metropolitanus]